MLNLELVNDEFTRGGLGRFRFVLTNTGAAPVEIVTAENTGKAPSSDIFFQIRDVPVTFAPGPEIPEGDYPFRLRVLPPFNAAKATFALKDAP